MDTRLALVLSCFFLSGFAALLYQTAWSRELSFVFGTSDLAVAAVLAAYMGGLALGAAAAARLAARVRRPVLAYGLLELGIAVSALLVPWGMHALDAAYVALLGGRDAPSDAVPITSTLFQVASAFAVLLPPTALMGATLPLLARHAVHREEEIAPRVGVLYAVNTAGAIAGTLCAAFWLMPELGLRRTVWIGAGLNFVVFALAALLARGAPIVAPSDTSPPPAMRGAGHWILPVIACSGAVSFTYEVLWTRLLGHVLGASVQAFATMLASFLLGIALGSAAAGRLGRRRERAALGFGLAQLGIGVTSYAAFALADRLPELARLLGGAGPNAPLASAAIAAAALLPVTLCIGVTFPFAVRVLARRPEEVAAATARVYAWNTVGAIVGALAAGFVLLPGLAFEGTLTVGVVISLLLAVTAALAAKSRPIALLAAVAIAVLVAAPAKPPWRVLRSSALGSPATGEIVYAAVGRSSTVIVTEGPGYYNLSTNGLPESSIDATGVLPQVGVANWLVALPAWLRPGARRLLVVGLGGGSALELASERFESIDVIELEPEVVAANRRLAGLRARDPLSDPRVRILLGDARGTLRLTPGRYDAIVSQPSHPWTAGASHLYTREFFSLARSRLEPDGVFVQWIASPFLDESLLRSLLAALTEVFPHVEVFQPQPNGLLFAASQAPIDALAGAAQSLRDAPEELALYGIHTIEDFASRWLLSETGVRALTEGVAPNSDDHNLLAARSARLGAARLEPNSLGVLTDPHDPLRSATGLEPGALIRALAENLQVKRARGLAGTQAKAIEAQGLGWIELEAGRSGAAARHFTRALELAPGDPQATQGLIGSRKVALSRGERVPGISEDRLDPRYAALIAGWRHGRAKEWQAVAELDAELARISPGEPLDEMAMRLRIEQRLATGEREAAAEAHALAATLLLRRWLPQDALLHARAAIRAEQPLPAFRSLQLVANHAKFPAVAGGQRARAFAERVLEIAGDLPEEQRVALETQLDPGKVGERSRGPLKASAAPRENR